MSQLRAPQYDYIEVISQTTFIQIKGHTSHLFHADGRLLAGPYYRINHNQVSGYLVARPNWNNEYILLDMDGRFIRNLESEPRLLAHNTGRPRNRI